MISNVLRKKKWTKKIIIHINFKLYFKSNFTAGYIISKRLSFHYEDVKDFKDYSFPELKRKFFFLSPPETWPFANTNVERWCQPPAGPPSCPPCHSRDNWALWSATQPTFFITNKGVCTILLKISPQFQNIWNIFSPLQRVSLYVSLLHERWHVQCRAGQRSGHRRQGDLLTKQAACMPHFKDKIHSALCTAFFCPTWRLFCRHQLSGVNSLLSIHLPVCVCVRFFDPSPSLCPSGADRFSMRVGRQWRTTIQPQHHSSIWSLCGPITLKSKTHTWSRLQIVELSPKDKDLLWDHIFYYLCFLHKYGMFTTLCTAVF